MYWDENNLYILLMSRKLGLDSFKGEKTNQCLMKVL